MKENIAWIQSLARNKNLAEDKIATIDNKIIHINLDSTSWQYHQEVPTFIFGHVAKHLKPKTGQYVDTENWEYLDLLSRSCLKYHL